jgi:hypothetical protein
MAGTRQGRATFGDLWEGLREVRESPNVTDVFGKGSGHVAERTTFDVVSYALLPNNWSLDEQVSMKAENLPLMRQLRNAEFDSRGNACRLQHSGVQV